MDIFFAVLLYPGKVHQVLNNGFQSSGVFVYYFKKAFSLLRSLWGAVPKGFYKTFYGGNGGFDLMGNIGHKVPSDIFKFPESSYVIQYDECADTVSCCIMENRPLFLENRPLFLWPAHGGDCG